MYRVRKKIKGLTILELILALAIGAMFSAIFFQFFIVHQKALNSTAVKSQLQYDMQQSMEYFSKSTMEASRISNINGVTDPVDPIDPLEINLGNLKGPQKLEKVGIIFSVENSDATQLNTYKYRVDGSNLYYTDGGSDEKTISSDIKYVQITPIGSTDTDLKPFKKCSGIIIEIELIGEDGKTTYNIANSFYFRNKNN